MPDNRLTSSRKAATYGDQEVIRGEGGETHQVAGGDVPVLTTQQGVPVADDQNSLRIGARGPTAAGRLPFAREDLPFRPRTHSRARRPCPRLRRPWLFRELRIAVRHHPRRPLSARRGEDAVFVRFSTVAGNKGSADLARDVRGFAVKFYTKEGNWDLVGNNIPVFFIQDAIKFPDLIHAAKQEPDRGFPQAQTAHDNFWDFISLMPESMHMVHVDHVRPDDPALLPLHGRLRRPHLPLRQCRRANPPSSSSTGSPSWACSRWSGTRR